jgi:hypothetical protein
LSTKVEEEEKLVFPSGGQARSGKIGQGKVRNKKGEIIQPWKRKTKITQNDQDVWTVACS